MGDSCPCLKGGCSSRVALRACLQTGQTYVDQLDLLREQVRLLADEIKLRDTTIKRLSEQAEGNPAQEAQISVRAFCILSCVFVHSRSLPQG